MSILRTVERRLEGIVEGFFASTFRSGVHPIEIANRIAREMEAGKAVGLGEVLAPNRFVVALAEADRARFAQAEGALAAELRTLVLGTAAERGFTLVGEPEVVFDAAPHLATGRFAVTATFEEGVRVPPPAPPASATLEVVEGGGTRTVALGVATATIGRTQDCEVVLRDPATSRHHARIVPVEDGFVLEDLGSTNGTLLNDEAIERALLEDGDVVTIGTTRIRFRRAG